jgi:nitrogen regulatory protein PII
MKKIEAVIKPFRLDDVKENPRLRASGGRRGTRKFTAVLSMWLIFFLRLR